MADIAVAAVIRKTLDIAANLLVEEGSRLYWLHEDIDWIERVMRRLQSYLADADAKQGGSQEITNFINDIRDLAYDIEDIMDVFFPWVANHNNRKGFMGFLKTVTCVFNDCYTAHCLAMEIQKIRRRVEDIHREKNNLGITESSDTRDARQTFSHIDEANIVGFEVHIENLKARLLSTDSKHSVISIVGMPGLGKTTLARKVYNSVKSDFECSAWVCASQDPVVKNLLQDVARQVGLEKEKWEQNVEFNLCEFLRRKRYVLVVDDIWDPQNKTDQKTWDALKVGIPTNHENGSRTIITSRDKSLGMYIGGASSLHELLPLKQDDSWKLFSKIVMDPIQSTNETRYSTELENLGRQITKRCGGVPLAIVVTAGLLSSRERTEFQWREVLESMGQEEDECYKILALSYKDLSAELKPCFLYFGIFPEDREIYAFQLINMWVAEGFVQARGEQLLEDVGENYLNQLIARNLVQAVRRRHNRRIGSCRIHDLLHNLCILEAVKSNFFNTRDNVIHNLGTRVRRVSMHRSRLGEYISLKTKTPNLRALLYFGNEVLERNHLKSLLGGFRLLRVLTVQCKHLRSLPNEIGSLRYLSYFEIDAWAVDKNELPSSMGNLQNLMTLIVQLCYYIEFPTFIWKMKKLRHVLISGIYVAPSVQLLRSHKTEFSLKNLQTLYDVPSECFEPRLLHKFTNLRILGIINPTVQAKKYYQMKHLYQRS